MGHFIARRFGYLLLVLLTVSAITFGLMHAVPGGPFDTEKRLPPEVIELMNKRYHLDDPLLVQYFNYLNDVLLIKITTEPPSKSLEEDHLININIGNVWLKWMNFGPSYQSRSRSVNDIIRQQFPISLQLGIMAFMIALIIGVPLGILAALNQNTIFDYFSMWMAIFGTSVPVIVLGLVMVWIFGIGLKWFPPTGWGARPPYVMGIFPSDLNWNYIKYAIMPSIALGLGSSAIIARLTRASLLQVIREDYIRTARSKGLKERLIVFRHALKNALIPVVTILGPMFAAIVTGSFVTEKVFGIPGLGQYFITSITNRDYPVIMGTVLLWVLLLVICNLFVDIIYAFLDPRIRYN